jgi:(E)-4-hydroxy-3-methylbut-2-enyl-diphosphate synthase
MTNTHTNNIKATLKQIKELYANGCNLVRLAVPDQKAVEAFSEIRKKIIKPLIADIHFDYRLAIGAIEAGADKIRINPGNIKDTDKLKEIITAAKKHRISIRIGVNKGSADKAILKLAQEYVKFFEQQKFREIVLSVKTSSVSETISTYQKATKLFNYPLHVGVTEAGTEYSGLIKSSIGIGALLAQGIGDTIRVSLTADPLKEVTAAKHILKALGLYKMPEVISCPTCGRTEIDIIAMARKVEKRLAGLNKNITVAVMGCVVNGPGEAKHADYGIAGGKGKGIIFAKGKKIKTVPENKLIDELFKLIK